MRSVHLKLALNTIVLQSIATAFVSPCRKHEVLPLLSTLTPQPIYWHTQRDSTMHQTLNSDDPTELPPHTALAQVLANQYEIDLKSVERRKRRDKITAADVEFHAYKISQPPCTPQALELAYSYGLDLTILADADDGESEDGQINYLKISDVELLRDNMRSLRASRQKVQGKTNLAADVRRKEKHLNELEQRMEKNVGQLSEKAMQAVGSVAGAFERVKSQVKLPSVDLFGTAAANTKFDSVQDFDQELADEIQAALASAGIDDEEAIDFMSLLDMPMNGNRAELQVNGINGSSNSDIVEDTEEENKSARSSSPALFFADPK